MWRNIEIKGGLKNKCVIDPQRKNFRRERLVSTQTGNYAHKVGRHKLRIEEYEKETKISEIKNIHIVSKM